MARTTAPTRNRKTQAKATSTSSRKTKKTLSQHRRQRKKIANEREKEEKQGRVVVDDFYEIEKIVGERMKRGRREYLVTWKGHPHGDTWEPSANLCDSAHKEAVKFMRQEETRRKRNEEGERLLGISVETHSKVEDLELTEKARQECLKETASKVDILTSNNDVAMVEEDTDASEFKDDDQVVFREVERIHVDDPNAKTRVTDARINGVPIVLTGHRGWPKFATRWLKLKQLDGKSKPSNNEELLDLSQPYEVDIEKMIEDIGEESVPILKKNYDERNPIQKEIFASTFLKKCWPANGEPSLMNKLYLHQWQFPMSNTAARKLCGDDKCVPLPNDIFNEDLLQFWLDRKVNPFQYIFMGDTGTMSKLHQDNGGLAITIAPLVGEKECVLAHRLDGKGCLYNLDSKLDAINLDKFPMTAFSRVWKTVVRPGEILVMPYGTFHQCRNVTPCLSYHRFHLDTVNLRPFLESMLEGDAPEIEHDDVIWNCATEMIDRIDKYTSNVRTERGHNMEKSVPVPEEISKTVDALRLLRLVCREIAIRLERHRYSKEPPKNPFFLNKSEDAASHYWPRMVQDIDHTLFDFSYRNAKDPPKFRARGGRLAGPSKEDSDDEEVSTSIAELEEAKSKSKPCQNYVADKDGFEKMMQDLPQLQPFQEDLVIPDSVKLEAGDEILIRFTDRKVVGSIVKVTDQMRAMYVTYEDLPSCFDEFQPIERIQQQKEVPASGESSSSIVTEEGDGATRTKQVVFCSLGGRGEARRAVVQSTKCATFYLVRLHMGKHSIDRWLYRESIFGKVETMAPSPIEGSQISEMDLPLLKDKLQGNVLIS